MAKQGIEKDAMLIGSLFFLADVHLFRELCVTFSIHLIYYIVLTTVYRFESYKGVKHKVQDTNER